MSTDTVSDYLARILTVGKNEGLRSRLKEVGFIWNTNGIQAEGTFCYLAFRDGQPTQDDLIEVLFRSIIDFSLPRQDIAARIQRIKDGDTSCAVELFDRAKSLFIAAKKKNSKSGEPGELLLFMLLEGLLNAPRIVAKMRLKTNPNMEVYGSDSIHMKYDQESQILTLYWGESKLYGDLSTAISNIASSVKAFVTFNPERAGTQRDMDIGIIQSHPDLDITSHDDTKEALLAYFNPYSEYSNKLREVHACLAVWDWEFYKKLNAMPEIAEAEFVSKYMERIGSACNLFCEKVTAEGLKKCRFHFFLLPVVDMTDLRRRFCAKVGLPFEEPNAKDATETQKATDQNG